MRNWYLTREGNGDLIHRGKVVPPGKKILLTNLQADLHQQKIIKTDAPKHSEELFFAEDIEQLTPLSPEPPPEKV